ncbi:hypothetical protein L6452_21644 [Arctium lappa]|uniref:Uncharacterized protein n=1 Tax=Arctium lappa TaxID=4217 RepID=A0ACB9B200_ARCLA|nr:hypothetical protein L6452_21644 [Arctium lappa]
MCKFYVNLNVYWASYWVEPSSHIRVVYKIWFIGLIWVHSVSRKRVIFDKLLKYGRCGNNGGGDWNGGGKFEGSEGGGMMVLAKLDANEESKGQDLTRAVRIILTRGNNTIFSSSFSPLKPLKIRQAITSQFDSPATL